MSGENQVLGIRETTFPERGELDQNHVGLRSERNVGLDVFRSAAILCVLTSHFIRQLGTERALREAGDYLGYFGVELFFVLSGFLIGGILMRMVSTSGATLATVRLFWARRWFRTLPNYYLYLVVSAAIPIALRRPIDGVMALYPFFLQNFWWPMSQFFIVSWSLAVEEWFYLLFPLGVYLAGKFVKDQSKMLMAAIAVFLTFPFVLRCFASGAGEWNTSLRMVAVYRLDAIAMGVALAWFKCNGRRCWQWLSAVWIMLSGAGLAVGICIWFTCNNLAEKPAGSIPYNALFLEALDLSCAMMLPLFASINEMNRIARFLFNRISIYSYSLYLSHLTVIHLTGWMAIKLKLQNIPWPVSVAIWTGATFLVSITSYYLVEATFLRFRDGIVPENKFAQSRSATEPDEVPAIRT